MFLILKYQNICSIKVILFISCQVAVSTTFPVALALAHSIISSISYRYIFCSKHGLRRRKLPYSDVKPKEGQMGGSNFSFSRTYNESNQEDS